jgi:hypothetical protein
MGGFSESRFQEEVLVEFTKFQWRAVVRIDDYGMRVMFKLKRFDRTYLSVSKVGLI